MFFFRRTQTILEGIAGELGALCGASRDGSRILEHTTDTARILDAALRPRAEFVPERWSSGEWQRVSLHPNGRLVLAYGSLGVAIFDERGERVATVPVGRGAASSQLCAAFVGDRIVVAQAGELIVCTTVGAIESRAPHAFGVEGDSSVSLCPHPSQSAVLVNASADLSPTTRAVRVVPGKASCLRRRHSCARA